MSGSPYGYLIGSVVLLIFVWLGLRPRPAPGGVPTPSYVLSTVSSELYVPLAIFAVAPSALAAVEGDLSSPVGLLALGLSVLALGGTTATLLRALPTAAVLEAALSQGLAAPVRLPRWAGPWELAQVLLAPVHWSRRDVVRLKDLRYGPAPGRANLMDLYRGRAQEGGAPVLVYFHGGGYSSGRKSREARLLLDGMASRGWVCVSANYQLRPARYPAPLEDAKRLIAWLRTEGSAYGVDGSRIVVAGGSSGAHLAMMCALTADDARFQPGFETADTAVLGAVGCYGYYGPVGRTPDGAGSSPVDVVHAGAPPIMLVHGSRDPMVPVEDARGLADRLRSVSGAPVVWAELPGGLHGFDRFASVRSAAVATAVEAFCDLLAATPAHHEPDAREGSVGERP